MPQAIQQMRVPFLKGDGVDKVATACGAGLDS